MPLPGRFVVSISRSIWVPASIAPRLTTLFSKVARAGSSAGSRSFSGLPSAASTSRMPCDEPSQLLRGQRGVVIGAVETLGEREVLLDRERAERDGGDRGVDVRRVVGEPVGDAEPLAHAPPLRAGCTCSGGAGYEEVHWRTRSSPAPPSLEHRERALDVLEPGHPGREQYRLARRRNGLEQRRIRDLAGGDLVERVADLLQQLDRLDREGAREEEQPAALGVVLQPDVLFAGELHPLRELPARLGKVGRGRRRGMHLRLRDVGLELDGVRTGLGRRIDQTLRLVDAAVVVVADLGDDQSRRALAHGSRADEHPATLATSPRGVASAREAGALPATARRAARHASRAVPRRYALCTSTRSTTASHA